jgi:uncharacterized protein (DUF305 family)
METRNSLKRLQPAALVLAAAVLLGGCFGGADDDGDTGGEAEVRIVQPGAPGEPSKSLSPDEAAKIESTKHTQADVDFMRGMIHHHAQALVMTSMVRERSASKDIPLLARRMEISQESEIEVMEKWLIDRGEKPPDAEDHKHDHGAGGGLMPGMVSEAKLARLAAAEGREFDALFLEYMMHHHRGALTMVSRLVAANGAAEPEIGAFTRHVEADQEIEIGRMRELLATLERKPARAAARRARPSKAAAERASRFAFAGGKPRICVIDESSS